MPQLDTKTPVLQALLDLRQRVVPLVAELVSRDREAVTSLKALNSRDNLTIEFSQLFFYLKEGQDLSDKDYNDLRNKLDTVLGLIDKLVDKDVLLTGRETETTEQACETPKDSATKGQHSMLGHQKLEALVNRAVDDGDSMDSSLLLHLPKVEEDLVQIEKAVTDFNEGNFERRKTAEQLGEDDESAVNTNYQAKPKLDKSKSETYIDAAKKSQACAESLLKIFTTNIARSECAHEPHFIKFPICDPMPCAGLHGGFQHRVFVSSCKSKDEWQETICDVVSQSPSPRNGNLQSIDNVCKTVRRRFKKLRKLNVLVDPEGLHHDPNSYELIDYPPFWPTLSLEDVLEDDDIEFKTANKVILATNLARALLRMCSGDMPVQELKANNIYFLFNPRNSMASEGYHPYLACSLVQRRDDEKSHVEKSEKYVDPFDSEKREDSINSNSITFPVIVSFARLLMEIAMWRKIGLHEVLLDMKHVVEVVGETLGGPYAQVIEWCLKVNFMNDFDSESESDLDSDSEHGSDSRNSRRPNRQDRQEQAQKKRKDAEKALCRNIMLHAVVSLEEFLKIFAPRIKPTSLFQFKAQKRTQRRMTVTKETGGPVLDNMRLNVGPTDQSVIWADEFFESAEEFYQRNIRCLAVSNDNRIRVTVLDTGVNDQSIFWRGRKRIRSQRDSPISEMKHFVGDSVEDSQGHGTNVAAIISKIAPEADLYIAKVSQGKENEGTQQIIDAIDWAVKHKVHVVNMSFYLPRSGGNQRVRKKIIEATSNGVIFVAAAANYGNNDVRGFPAKLKEVICVYAVDGKGNKSKMNPPTKEDFNFGSLGVAVKSEWDTDEVYLEGTSYATPVVTGMISNVLRFVKYAYDKKLLAEEYYKEAFSSRGMSNILGAMAELTSDGHHYIRPNWKIWSEDDTMPDVVTKIKTAMLEDMD